MLLTRWINRNSNRQPQPRQQGRLNNEPAAMNQIQPVNDLVSTVDVALVKLGTGAAISQSMLNRYPSLRSNQSSMSTRFKRLVSNVREELQCGICLEEYSCPRLLHCGHSYCAACLVSIHHGTTLRCPTCRTLTKFPDAHKPNVEDLPINYAILSIQDVVKVSGAKRTLLCKTHVQEELKLYCQQCECLLCSECLVSGNLSDDGHDLVSHQGHNVISIRNAAIDLYRELETLKTQAEKSATVALETIKSLENYKERLESNRADLCQVIESDFEAAVLKLKHRKEQVLKDLDSLSKQETAAIDKKLESANCIKIHVEETIASTEKLLINQSTSIRRASLVTIARAPNPSCGLEQLAPKTSTKDLQAIWQSGPSLKRTLEKLPTPDVLRAEVALEPCCLDRIFVPNATNKQLDDTIDNYVFVELTNSPQPATQILVKGIDGKTTMINLFSWQIKVQDLMEKISTLLTIPVEHQRLYHEGKLMYQLDPLHPTIQKRLSDYGVSNGSTVHLGLGILDRHAATAHQ